MPRNFTSLLYTAQLAVVIIISTLYNAFTASPDTNNAGAIAMAVVIFAFLLFVIFRSLTLINTKEKHIALWGGIVLVAIGSILVQFLLRDTSLARYSIVAGLLVAFAINFVSNKWLESIGQKD